MRIGTVSIELEVSLRFHDDGTLSGLEAMKALGTELAVSNYLHLSCRDSWDKVVADCWDNSEPVDG